MSFPWPYRRIATEEAFSVPEVYQALRGWAATADPAEPDQDFWDFVFTQDSPGLHRRSRGALMGLMRAADAHRRFAAHGVRGRLALTF